MSDLSPEGRSLLRSMRNDLDASPSDRDRVGRALAARLGIAEGGLGATAAVQRAPDSAVKRSPGTGEGAQGAALLTGTKWVGALLLFAAVGFGAASAEQSARDALRRSPATAPLRVLAQASPGPSPSPAPVVHDDGIPARVAFSAAPEPRPGGALSTGNVIAAAPRAIHALQGSLGRETFLLRRADEELQAGHAASALDLLNEHARLFPHGILSEERSAERVTALCNLGRIAEARVEARSFLALRADSPLAKAVASSCGGMGRSAEDDRRP